MHKSEYLKDLLEISEYENNLDIQNIDPFIFKIIISMISGNNIKKDIAEVYDFLRINEKASLIKDLQCMENECSHLNIEGEYCLLHKCCVNDCVKKREIGDHCKYHNCKWNYCIKKVNWSYCNEHECYVDNCHGKGIIDGHCGNHNCGYHMCKKLVITDGFCNEHKCIIEDCGRMKSSQNYCYPHQYEMNIKAYKERNKQRL